MIEIKQYYLMHKNQIAEMLLLDANDGKLIDSDVLNKTHAPIGHSDKKAFSNWWERRSISSPRWNE